jgi:hypothetical protein
MSSMRTRWMSNSIVIASLNCCSSGTNTPRRCRFGRNQPVSTVHVPRVPRVAGPVRSFDPTICQLSRIDACPSPYHLTGISHFKLPGLIVPARRRTPECLLKVLLRSGTSRIFGIVLPLPQHSVVVGVVPGLGGGVEHHYVQKNGEERVSRIPFGLYYHTTQGLLA